MTVGTGAGLLWWYNHEKDQKMEDIGRDGKSSVVVGQVRAEGEVGWWAGCCAAAFASDCWLHVQASVHGHHMVPWRTSGIAAFTWR